MLACDFGVTRSQMVADVVAVMFVVGWSACRSTDSSRTPYTVEPRYVVISTRLRPADTLVPSDSVTAVIVSVPVPVWNVNASAIVAAPPGRASCSTDRHCRQRRHVRRDATRRHHTRLRRSCRSCPS